MTFKDALVAELNKTTPQTHPALHANAGANIPWATIIQLILAIIAALNPPAPTPGPTPTP